jgi:hypothetical protein
MNKCEKCGGSNIWTTVGVSGPKHYNHIIYDPDNLVDFRARLEKRLLAVKSKLRGS